MHKTRKFICLMLIIALVLSIASISFIYASADGANSTGVKVNGVIHNAHIGDIVHYEYWINLAGIPAEGDGVPGKISNVEGVLHYSDSNLKVVSSLEEDDDTGVNPFMPNIKSNCVIGNDEPNEINYNASKNFNANLTKGGFDFSKNKVLISVDFEIITEGVSEIINEIKNMFSHEVKLYFISEPLITVPTEIKVTVNCTHVQPTEAPTQAPTQAPTAPPTSAPTQAPTQAPTAAPTSAPTQAPTQAPTAAPTSAPTQAPTQAPTAAPTSAPTQAPTKAPTEAPTVAPTEPPTEAPVVLLGDSDSDASITILDANCIQRWLAKLITDDRINLDCSDTDYDTFVTILDATEIQRWLAHLPANEDIGKPMKF